MKKVLFLLGVFYCVSQVCAQQNTAPLTDIVRQISNSWQEVEAVNKDKIKLTEVTASFTLSKTTSLGAEIKIWIFKLGRKVDKNKVHAITLNLAKNDKQVALADGKVKASKELTNFINATLSDFKKMDTEDLLSDLPKRKITLEIGLTITKDTNGGGGYEIGIFTLTAEGGKKSEQGHKLTLVFEKTS